MLVNEGRDGFINDSSAGRALHQYRRAHGFESPLKPDCFSNFIHNCYGFSSIKLFPLFVLSLFFGDYMDRKANPRLYDEIQDTESLSVVS